MLMFLFGFLIVIFGGFILITLLKLVFIIISWIISFILNIFVLWNHWLKMVI